MKVETSWTGEILSFSDLAISFLIFLIVLLSQPVPASFKLV